MPLCASVYLCLVVTCWERGWPLGRRLWCTTVSLSLSHWYPGSGVVLDYIDSRTLHSYYYVYFSLSESFSKKLVIVQNITKQEVQKYWKVKWKYRSHLNTVSNESDDLLNGIPTSSSLQSEMAMSWVCNLSVLTV